MRPTPILFSLLIVGAVFTVALAQEPAAPVPFPFTIEPATPPPPELNRKKMEPIPGPPLSFQIQSPRFEAPPPTLQPGGPTPQVGPPLAPPPGSEPPPAAGLPPAGPPPVPPGPLGHSAGLPKVGAAIPLPPHPWDGRPIVFVANGAGGGTSMGDNLRWVAQDMRTGLVIRTAPWSRYGTVYGDNADYEGHLQAAAKLAQHIQDLRGCCPHSRFVLVGYSAGTRVILATAEMLPPCSIDRIVLCASSVSCGYDLRPALRASCGGIDNFYSRADSVLATAEASVLTTDGQKSAMAGRVGFRYPCDEKACGAYANVRQIRWHADMGGQGEHTFWARPWFMRRGLVPLLLTPGCAVTFLGETAAKAPPLPPLPLPAK